ncbi:MAG: putative sulfate exporter family transporter, partial [Bacilli bacterium]
GGIMFTLLIGRAMGLEGNLPLLIGIGTSICGATAIAATSPIMKAKEAETAFAVTTIFVFNVIAVIAYPLIGSVLGLSNEAFGIWAGTSVHDTSSVVAAGYAYSDEAGGIATIVKLTRTMFLIPVAIIVGIYISMKDRKDRKLQKKTSLYHLIPWFVFGFLCMSIFNTMGLFSEQVVSVVVAIAKFIILMAMASVGLGANFKKIRKLGMKPLLLGLLASVIVAVGSLVLIYWMV